MTQNETAPALSPGPPDGKAMQDLDRKSRDTFRSWARERIRQSDTDQQGHVNNSIIATYFEIGRIDLFGEQRDEVTPPGVSIVVAKSTIEFLKELRYPGTIEIGTRLVRVGRSSFSVIQGLFQGTTCYAVAEATCVFIDQATRRPYAVPDNLRAKLLGL